MSNKKNRTVYIDIEKWGDWEIYCELTGRVLNKIIPLAIEKYIKENPPKQ